MMDATRADLALLAESLDADGPAEVAACHRDFDATFLRLGGRAAGQRAPRQLDPGEGVEAAHHGPAPAAAILRWP